MVWSARRFYSPDLATITASCWSSNAWVRTLVQLEVWLKPKGISSKHQYHYTVSNQLCTKSTCPQVKPFRAVWTLVLLLLLLLRHRIPKHRTLRFVGLLHVDQFLKFLNCWKKYEICYKMLYFKSTLSMLLHYLGKWKVQACCKSVG